MGKLGVPVLYNFQSMTCLYVSLSLGSSGVLQSRRQIEKKVQQVLFV